MISGSGVVAYEDWFRGRIVFDRLKKRFVLYAWREVNATGLQSLIPAFNALRLGLTERFGVSDSIH